MIKNLTLKTLKQANNLVLSTFKGLDEYEKKNLIASLFPNRFKEVYLKNEIREMEYFVYLVDDEVVGVVGLYSEIEDNEDECWLGWFCVDKKYRNQKIGKKLFEYALNLAKQRNKKTLYIYTYDTKMYQKAILMYQKYGFKQIEVKSKYKRDLYFKKGLK